VTTGQEWYSLSTSNDYAYSFVIQYAGQTYNFTAPLEPVSVTCATLFVPSGKTSVSILAFQMSCPSGNSDALRLQMSISSNETTMGQTIQVNVSEFNTLASQNNISTSEGYQVPVALSACPNTNFQPFGIALYRGHYTAQNVSLGAQLQIFPPTACPLYERYISGYVFEPNSDIATILPGSGLTPMSASLDIVNGTAVGEGQGTLLDPGSYTVVAADEWGNMVFLYFQVNGLP
jgi:hypothetical protein